MVVMAVGCLKTGLALVLETVGGGGGVEVGVEVEVEVEVAVRSDIDIKVVRRDSNETDWSAGIGILRDGISLVDSMNNGLRTSEDKLSKKGLRSIRLVTGEVVIGKLSLNEARLERDRREVGFQPWLDSS